MINQIWLIKRIIVVDFYIKISYNMFVVVLNFFNFNRQLREATT